MLLPAVAQAPPDDFRGETALVGFYLISSCQLETLFGCLQQGCLRLVGGRVLAGGFGSGSFSLLGVPHCGCAGSCRYLKSFPSPGLSTMALPWLSPCQSLFL